MTANEKCALAANGSHDAERFCVAWARFCHLLDDVIDKDNPVTDEDIARELVSFLANTITNKFVGQHRESLMSIMVQSANAWLDSNRMPAGGERDVLKGMWHEVIWHVAYLTGGWQHMRFVTQTCREYDIEKEVLNG
jgi:hypothetical protein